MKQVSGLLAAAARLSARELTDALRKLDLSPAQFAIIDLIDREGPLFPSNLARRLSIETSTMAASLKRAERDGFIQRSQDPKDGRGVVVDITAQARLVLEDARKASNMIDQRSFPGMKQDQIDCLGAGLKTLVKNLKG